MLSGNSVLNNPIIAANTAAALGSIGGTLIDPRLRRIAAFTLERTAREAMIVLPWMGVKRLEDGQIFAWAATMIVRAEELFDVRQLLKGGTLTRGTRFHSADGIFLGEMADFFFDPHSGLILRYEVIGGPFVDGKTGHGFLPALANTTVEKETSKAFLPLKFAALARLMEVDS